MRFREKLKFFVFGGCFVAVGVALTYLSDINADEKDFGKIKSFDTIVCKSLAILDDDNKPRIYLSVSDNTPLVNILNGEGSTDLSLSGSEPELSSSIIIGNINQLHTQISTYGIVKRRNTNVVSEWPQ